MKSSINLARPDIAFCVPWLIVLACYLPLATPLTPPMEVHVAWLLGINLLSAPVILIMVTRAVSRRLGHEEISRPVFSTGVSVLVHRFLMCLFWIWSALFVASIIYSGGLPIIWSITSDSRTYADFGIPTVGGLLILLRMAASVLAITMFLVTHRKFYLLLWLIMMLDCTFELSRSALFMLFCESICALLLLQQIKFHHFLLALIGTVSLVGIFIGLGSLRNITTTANDFQIAQFGNLPLGLYWAWTYIVSPLGNVNHAAALGIEPGYLPVNSFIKLIPTAIVTAIGIQAAFPIKLITPSLNATSIYGPLIADFGFFGAGLFMAAFQVFASYAYVMARRGRILYVLFYPALFGSLVLSIFFIYAISLPVLLVPAIFFWMRQFVRRRLMSDDDSGAFCAGRCVDSR